MTPSPGQLVRVRSRQYLVEDVVPPPAPNEQTLVRLSCLEDDAQGEPLSVLWEKEIDVTTDGFGSWRPAQKGFDAPRLFAAYLNTLRWNCVTATDPKLFQSPHRAGIELMAYQLEPLRKALLLPRVNLFIADDVGLGKTIEAGLIVRELLMRQKVRRIVVAAPASVVLQWRDELENRFGLTFVVFDRDFVLATRRERGYAVNPCTTHSRFVISHSLLRDPAYSEPLRQWLGDFDPGSLLVLDEAHNAAPASGAKYAVDSQFTRVIRDLAPLFEHRLFLSATPHNGHSNSFAALLEMLDPQRFCRGVPVRSQKVLDAVMVRRLKQDLREAGQAFPVRRTIQIDIDHLPETAPELALARLLDEYRAARAQRLLSEKRSIQNAATLVTMNLQKRLFSSVEAFARTLEVHRVAIDRQDAKARASASDDVAARFPLLAESPGADDDRAEVSETEVQDEEDAQMTTASRVFGIVSARERELLEEMTGIAASARHLPDPRVQKLIAFIRANPDRRVLVFTEYTDTKRYLEQQLRASLYTSPRDQARLAVFHGGMSEDSREEVKRAFNSDPSKHPLRVLIATDAAREGVNLQNHCADLFHFDLPWNPSRMEQRNGRIDRKLQRSPEVRCHYFFFVQRPEDRVLQTLVRKTETIQRELGSLARVLENRVDRMLSAGIRRDDVDRLASQIESATIGPADQTVVDEELEVSRERKQALLKQLDTLRSLVKLSEDELGFNETAFRDAISCALELQGAPPLQPLDGSGAVAATRWQFPALDEDRRTGHGWAETIDTLRAPRRKDQKPWDWRRESRPRPVVFEDAGSLDGDVVHLHLSHRVVQRLLGRFLAHGFVDEGLSRACLLQSRDAIPRVVLIGRLSLYGAGAARLHDELLPVSARWFDPQIRKEPLKQYSDEAGMKTARLLEDALAAPGDAASPIVTERLLATAERDIAELMPWLDAQSVVAARQAEQRLTERGQQEALAMEQILDEQRKSIEKIAKKHADPQLVLDFGEDERRQLEADRRHWETRLASLADERVREPERIRVSYHVRARRLEPVGLVYLWPASG